MEVSMAFSFYLNTEKLTLEIAQQHIECMTDQNHAVFDGVIDDIYIDDVAFKNNLANGFVAITQLSCFFESFLNTILNSCINYSGEDLLKCNTNEKIELIFLYYNKDFTPIKSTHNYEVYRITTKVRNELIHFKNTYIGDSSGLFNFELCKNIKVGDYFTKRNLSNIYENYIDLSKAIANALGLLIYDDVDIFACDGRDMLINYVMNSNDINI